MIYVELSIHVQLLPTLLTLYNSRLCITTEVETAVINSRAFLEMDQLFLARFSFYPSKRPDAGAGVSKEPPRRFIAPKTGPKRLQIFPCHLNRRRFHCIPSLSDANETIHATCVPTTGLCVALLTSSRVNEAFLTLHSISAHNKVHHSLTQSTQTQTFRSHYRR